LVAFGGAKRIGEILLVQKITLADSRPEYPPAYVANGLIGLRVGRIPLLKGSALVNGLFGIQGVERIESYQPAPYPIGGDIRVGRIWLSQRPDFGFFKEQTYDFSCGELHSLFDFKVDAVTAHVEVITFCSRTQPTLMLQQVSVTVDQPCKLVLRGIMDTEGLPGKCLRCETPNPGWDVVDGCLHWESIGGLSSCGAASWTGFLGDDSVKSQRNRWGYENAMFKDYTISARPGGTYILQQIGGLVPSVMHPHPDQQALRLVLIGRHWGFEELRRENRSAWDNIWRGRLLLLGADSKWQTIADAAYFYLHSSVHRSSPCGPACFGLGEGRNYWGNVFWDAEIYMLPPLLLTDPEAARAMLDYRSRMLPAARNNAALHGYSGAQFPWQSSGHGGENVVCWACGVFAEQHISLDVAFAFAQYAHGTGDEQFLGQQAWPVLKGVADWIVSRARKTARGYEIRHVTGVDEGIENVDNNSYTNMAATVILREAQGFARHLGITPPALWAEVERHMFIPVDPLTNVILKHDRHQLDKTPIGTEPLLGFFPLTYRASPEVELATIKACLQSAPAFMNLPFVPALVGVFAARLGDRKFSGELFSSGVANFVVEPFKMFCEFSDITPGARPPFATPFLTCMGSFLMACLYGLTGMQMDSGAPEDWFKVPVAMPELWDGVESEQIWVRGRQAHLLARHGDQKGKIEFI
jgi:hypothetical protein